MLNNIIRVKTVIDENDIYLSSEMQRNAQLSTGVTGLLITNDMNGPSCVFFSTEWYSDI